MSKTLIYGIEETSPNMLIDSDVLDEHGLFIFAKNNCTNELIDFVYGIELSEHFNESVFETVDLFCKRYSLGEACFIECYHIDLDAIIDNELYYDFQEYIPLSDSDCDFDQNSDVDSEYNYQKDKLEQLSKEFCDSDSESDTEIETEKNDPMDFEFESQVETFYRNVHCYEDIYVRYSAPVW